MSLVSKHPTDDERAKKYTGAITRAQIETCAAELGVSPDSLRALRVGFNSALCFPEHDERGHVTGICKRHRDGAKKVGRGQKRGCNVPVGFKADGATVLCDEGASDTAAMVTMGLTAVGRPSASGGGNKRVGALAGVVFGEMARSHGRRQFPRRFPESYTPGGNFDAVSGVLHPRW